MATSTRAGEEVEVAKIEVIYIEERLCEETVDTKLPPGSFPSSIRLCSSPPPSRSPRVAVCPYYCTGEIYFK